ncbi:MAG TPA: hypothetical protein VGW38_24430, partial [Chloroflexota bacterium]|nr:hypothetical protein [Chloroflexota bacterium]
DPTKPPKHADLYLEAPAHARWTPNLTNWEEISAAVSEAFAPLLRGEQSAKDAANNAKQAIETLLPQGELFQ